MSNCFSWPQDCTEPVAIRFSVGSSPPNSSLTCPQVLGRRRPRRPSRSTPLNGRQAVDRSSDGGVVSVRGILYWSARDRPCSGLVRSIFFTTYVAHRLAGVPIGSL